MDDYRRNKKRFFSIFENAKKRKNLNEASHSNERCIPPDDFKDVKSISTPQKQKTKISNSSPSFAGRIDKYLVNQPSSVSSEKLRISCNTVTGVAGNWEHEIDNTDNVKDDDDLDESFFSDSFLDTIDTNAIVDMVNTTEMFEKESQIKCEVIMTYDSNSESDFKLAVSQKTEMENVSCNEDSCFGDTKTQTIISKDNKEGLLESSTLHSLKTRDSSSPVKKTLNEKYYSLFKQKEITSPITAINMDKEENTPSIPGSPGSQQVNARNGKQQKTSDEDLKKNEIIKRRGGKRARPSPSKSAKIAVKKQPKTRIRKINVAKTPKNTYGKLSEDKLDSVEIRKIPQHYLNEVLDMLQNEDHEVWRDRNISCNAGIHRYWETRPMVSDKNMKLKYARQFLLRREWLNLSKILCLFNTNEKNNTYYPLLVKVIS